MNLVLVVWLVIWAFPPFFSLQLPAELVVRAVVQEFTAICESSLLSKQWLFMKCVQLASKTTKTGFLVVFTDVRLVIPSDGGSDVGRSSDGASSHSSRCCISLSCVPLLIVLGIVCHASVNFIVGFSLQFLLNC